jgi:hypothetical protein
MPGIKATFNHNDYLQFRLTDESARVINATNAKRHQELTEAGVINLAKRPLVSPGEVCKMQFWDFCQVLGPHMGLCKPVLVENGVIELV